MWVAGKVSQKQRKGKRYTFTEVYLFPLYVADDDDDVPPEGVEPSCPWDAGT